MTEQPARPLSLFVSDWLAEIAARHLAHFGTEMEICIDCVCVEDGRVACICINGEQKTEHWIITLLNAKIAELTVPVATTIAPKPPSAPTISAEQQARNFFAAASIHMSQLAPGERLSTSALVKAIKSQQEHLGTGFYPNATQCHALLRALSQGNDQYSDVTRGLQFHMNGRCSFIHHHDYLPQKAGGWSFPPI